MSLSLELEILLKWKINAGLFLRSAFYPPFSASGTRWMKSFLRELSGSRHAGEASAWCSNQSFQTSRIDALTSVWRSVSSASSVSTSRRRAGQTFPCVLGPQSRSPWWRAQIISMFAEVRLCVLRPGLVPDLVRRSEAGWNQHLQPVVCRLWKIISCLCKTLR